MTSTIAISHGRRFGKSALGLRRTSTFPRKRHCIAAGNLSPKTGAQFLKDEWAGDASHFAVNQPLSGHAIDVRILDKVPTDCAVRQSHSRNSRTTTDGRRQRFDQ